MKAQLLCLLLIVPLFLTPLSLAKADDSELFTLSGNVFTSDGLLADATSIKVDSMSSSWSENGSYVFTGISSGEHTVRAYFMNNGHTVVYRKMIIQSDMQLDWYEGMNWATIEMFDSQNQHVINSPATTVKLLETGENKSLEDGRTEFGLIDIGQYYTIQAYYGDLDQSTQFVHFKLQNGDANNPDLNDFKFHHGMNSKYGFIKDNLGLPVSGVTVNVGANNVISNDDGFYLLQNLEVGSTQTITFTQHGINIQEPLDVLITDGEGWHNITSNVKVELPENVNFVTTIDTIQLSTNKLIQWSGGDYTDYYSLYQNPCSSCNDDNLVYNGAANSFLFTPLEAGTYEFQIKAKNTNGSTESFETLLIIVLPAPSDTDMWSSGMSWNYSLTHTPKHNHNRTYTAIGTEIVTDAFGHEREAFLVRVSDDTYEEGEKSYRWVDVNNLLNIKTYWVDDPSSSSYFQEGLLGWDFTNNGQPASLLSGEPDTLHFNRTNIIGVPGHPNGYDDTQNEITITKDVIVETPAGIFSTTYFHIKDVNDGFVSWELWYNETVRNWVKIIDRLPGSHSDSVISVLTSFEVPITPQFITENGNLNVNEYSIDWATFQGASSYQLFENDVLIYQGSNISIDLKNKNDGVYLYKLNAIMDSGQIVVGGSLLLDVFFILEVPLISASTEITTLNEIVTFTWEGVENIDWYSIKVENSEGVIEEIYNGTQNFTEINTLEIGQNRIRLQAALQNGKVSGLSPSIFVTVEGLECMIPEGCGIPEENNGMLPAVSVPSTILAISLAIFFRKRWEKNE